METQIPLSNIVSNRSTNVFMFVGSLKHLVIYLFHMIPMIFRLYLAVQFHLESFRLHILKCSAKMVVGDQ